MKNFNVGDKVYISSQKAMATIIRIRTEVANCNVPYLIEFDSGFTMWVSSDSLTKPGVFNVGDRVISLNYSNQGQAGTVFRTYPDLAFCTVEWDSGIISNKNLSGIRLMTNEDKPRLMVAFEPKNVLKLPEVYSDSTYSVKKTKNTKTGIAIVEAKEYIELTKTQLKKTEDTIISLQNHCSMLKHNLAYIKNMVLKHDNK